MPRRANQTRIDELLGQASRLISRAEALIDQGIFEAARQEWSRAAETEEEAACLLEMSGREREAAVHRVSAASCYEQVDQPFRAITLLQAALASEVREPYRERILKQIKRCRKSASKLLVSQIAT